MKQAHESDERIEVERIRPMSRNLSLAVTLLTLVSLPFSTVAIAGVGDNAGVVVDLLKRTSPVEESQYYTFDDNDYCWYDEGWQGPGWYWCDYEWESGVGWGGPYGWNGWGGGHHRPRHRHGVGTWHPKSPTDRRVGGGGLRSPRPGHHLGGLPGVHAPSGESGVSQSFHFGGEPTVHNFGGVAPQTFDSFGGGGFHGFGGGGSFPSGGRGGGGHR